MLSSQEVQQIIAGSIPQTVDSINWLINGFQFARRVPVDSPQRFRIEMLFSPGANFNPYEVVPLHKDHTLPVQPRVCLHKGEHTAVLQSHCCLAKPPRSLMEACVATKTRPCLSSHKFACCTKANTAASCIVTALTDGTLCSRWPVTGPVGAVALAELLVLHVLPLLRRA